MLNVGHGRGLRAIDRAAALQSIKQCTAIAFGASCTEGVVIGLARSRR